MAFCIMELTISNLFYCQIRKVIQKNLLFFNRKMIEVTI